MEFHLFGPDALLAYAAYFIGTVSPGPSNLSIMSVAMHSGRRSAFIFAAGVVSGSMFWALLAALGLSALLVTYSNLLVFIKLFGGAYLLWLAAKSARAACRPAPLQHSSGIALRADMDAEAGSGRRLYLRGLGLHLTNPKAILTWLSIVSLALPAGADTSHALAIVGGCVCIGITVFGGYAMLFSTAAARRIYVRVRRWFEGVLAVVFAFAGIKLLLSRS
ncbi:LysE family translocator [Noviherbaspirillum malthae]|jgi:threonine/homoserine/homoserine lactone efflux protein|uniref:LysE family translocator n=1 Tax=Noviherbaspirillum malthae TaxID=1260987 RepID=UPI0018905EBC|nr:LysE family translocator [Noviherbaspirillum malthae]